MATGQGAIENRTFADFERDFELGAGGQGLDSAPLIAAERRRMDRRCAV